MGCESQSIDSSMPESGQLWQVDDIQPPNDTPSHYPTNPSVLTPQRKAAWTDLVNSTVTAAAGGTCLECCKDHRPVKLNGWPVVAANSAWVAVPVVYDAASCPKCASRPVAAQRFVLVVVCGHCMQQPLVFKLSFPNEPLPKQHFVQLTVSSQASLKAVSSNASNTAAYCRATQKWLLLAGRFALDSTFYPVSAQYPADSVLHVVTPLVLEHSCSMIWSGYACQDILCQATQEPQNLPDSIWSVNFSAAPNQESLVVLTEDAKAVPNPSTKSLGNWSSQGVWAVTEPVKTIRSIGGFTCNEQKHVCVLQNSQDGFIPLLCAWRYENYLSVLIALLHQCSISVDIDCRLGMQEANYGCQSMYVARHVQLHAINALLQRNDLKHSLCLLVTPSMPGVCRWLMRGAWVMAIDKLGCMNVWSAETGQCLAVSEPADNSINALTGKSQLFAPQPDLHNCPDRNPTASGGHCSSTQALCTAAGGSTVCLDIVRPQRMYGTAFSSCDLSEVEAIGAMREGDAICSCTCVLPAECFGSGSSCTVHVISYTGIIRHCLREDEKVLAAFSRFWTESLSALWKTREGAYGLPAPGKVFLGPLYESSSWPPPENPLDSVIRAFQTLLDSMSQSSCSKMKCMLLLLPLSNPSKICLKETPTTVLLWELIMRSWEQGLVLGSRRLHQQLYQQYMRPLAEQSPTLFMLYLKGATVQLPGTMQWPRTGICDGTAIDGLLPPVQLTLFGWAPWPQQHEGPPSRFSWDLWSMPRRPANRMYVASWNYFRLWWWLREPEQQEQRQMPYMVASHMIPMPGAVGVLERKDSSLLLDIVKCNLPAEAYSLPLVRALVHIKWQVYGASAVIAVLILEVWSVLLIT